MKTPSFFASLITGFAALIFGGLFGGIGYYAILKPELRAKNEFLETKCTVLSSRLDQSTSRDKKNRIQYRYRPDIHYRYSVNGKEYESTVYDIAQIYSSSKTANQAIVDKFVVNGEYACFYDPLNPATAVLYRETSWLGWILVSIGAVAGVVAFFAFAWWLFLLLVLISAMTTGR